MVLQIKDRIAQFRGTLKTMAVDRVPAHYGFIDISMIENPTPSTILEVKEKNCALVTKLKERFYYRVCDMYLATYPTDVS
jgi:hypothetical protein